MPPVMQALTTVSGASNEVLRRAVVNVLRGTATQPELPARFSGSLSSVGMEDVSIVAATESQVRLCCPLSPNWHCIQLVMAQL